MDVLHLIKSDHEAIRSGIKRLGDLNGVRSRRDAVEQLARDLDVHLTLEREYLYPEIQGLFQGADDLLSQAEAASSAVERKLKALRRLVLKTADEQREFHKKVSDLDEVVNKHFDLAEQGLMPKMRGLIRTEDREELGEVFLDVKQDLLKSWGNVVSVGSRKKKRA